MVSCELPAGNSCRLVRLESFKRIRIQKQHLSSQSMICQSASMNLNVHVSSIGQRAKQAIAQTPARAPMPLIVPYTNEFHKASYAASNEQKGPNNNAFQGQFKGRSAIMRFSPST